jgi:DNA-binding transcriptional regulator YhcF (GntR family)
MAVLRNSSVFKHLMIDYTSITPIYLQLANSVTDAIANGKVLKDDMLPSINELAGLFEISRNTAERSYKYLKEAGILKSVPGLGIFVNKIDIKKTTKILLLFNKLSAHKKIIYDAFIDAMGEECTVDFYIYNNDFDFFKRLLQKSKNEYTHYVIIPHFLTERGNADEIINEIPSDKLILMDKLMPGVKGAFGAVYENFEKNIFDALEKALARLTKYHTIKIVFPKHTYYPKDILKGFYRFCIKYEYKYEVVHNINNEKPAEGTAYITLMENDLVVLVEKLTTTNFTVGKDIGIISYNETPLKKIILKGITTISTDFQMMGEKAAELIRNKSTDHIEIPFYLTLRASL